MERWVNFKMFVEFLLILAVMVAIWFVPWYIIKVIPSKIRYQQLKSTGIINIDRKSGKDFELWLKNMFSNLGYRIKMTPITSDGGADLILTSSRGKKIAVQAKKSAGKNIGVKAVEEIMRGQKVYGCDEAWVVTNQYYTKDALSDAKKCGVVLWNRDDLLKTQRRIQQAHRKNNHQKTNYPG
ncbi:MAG: restriction endonuclease [Firmicutes bacterium]|nr:restriction endonuclease [Bacillota bacterium]